MDFNNLNRVEIIKKDDVIQLRISDGDLISSYIIDPYNIKDEWREFFENTFKVSSSIIKKIESDNE